MPEEIEKLKKAVILLNGKLPELRYSFEKFELENSPVAYYKHTLINIVHGIKDEWYERDHHCSSRDCSGWKYGPAPDSCKSCVNYHEEDFNVPKVQELYI